MNLKSKHLLIIDHGLKSFMAEFMARYYGKVSYYIPVHDPYLKSSVDRIGSGIPTVEWVEDVHKAIDECNVIWFPDIYMGAWQENLRKHGYLVCGSGKGEKMELDKWYFKEVLEKVGLPIPKTYLAEGIDEVWEYVKDKQGPLWMKAADKYRGDWESTVHLNKHQTEILLNHKRSELGKRASTIRILIESNIKSDCEVGVDGFRLNDKIAENSCIGYECKDEGYVCKVFNKPPKILADILDKIGPEYAKLGYQGPYSNEVRITESGKAYPIDETCRPGEPPTAILCELYGESYAQAIYSLASGVMPILKPIKQYGAQIVLSSPWHEHNEIHIDCPKEIRQWLKLCNYYRKNGQDYCVENGNEGVFGSMVATGNSVKEATNLCLERVKQLTVYKLRYNKSVFDEVEESIKAGRAHGIQI